MHIYFTHVEDGLCDRRGAVRQPSFHQFPCYIKPKWKDSAIFAACHCISSRARAQVDNRSRLAEGLYYRVNEASITLSLLETTQPIN
jgi:hypothetical protein